MLFKVLFKQIDSQSIMVRKKEIYPNLSRRIASLPNVVSDIITTEEIYPGLPHCGVLDATTIIFVLKGKGILDKGKSGQISLGEGVAVILPIASRYYIGAVEDMLVCYFTLDHRLGNPVSYCRIPVQTKRSKSRMSFPLLQMNDKIWIFLTNTISFINDGMSDGNYQVMKIKEFFHILNAYYSPEVISRFCLPLFSKDALFAGIVYQNWESVESLDKLADLAGLSLSGFSKRFKKVFGIAPYKWIMNRKGEGILQDLSNGIKSMKQIAEEYGFYSVQHFGHYCKKRFGLPPGRIRQLNKGR